MIFAGEFAILQRGNQHHEDRHPRFFFCAEWVRSGAGGPVATDRTKSSALPLENTPRRGRTVHQIYTGPAVVMALVLASAPILAAASGGPPKVNIDSTCKASEVEVR